MRTKLLILGVCFLFGATSVYSLFLYTDNRNHRPGAFIRYMDPHTFRNYHSIDLKYNSYYLAGVTDSAIYLANNTAVQHILKCSYLADTQQLSISADKLPEKLKSPRWFLQSPNLYLSDGQNQIILAFSIPDFILIHQLKTDFRFNNFLAIKPDEFKVRILDDTLKQLVWVNLNDSLGNLRFQPDREKEGFFSVDGLLKYDSSSQQIIYAYYYKNKISILDMNLRTVQSFHTIDTNFTAKIHVASISSQNVTTLAKEPVTVNKKIAVYHDTLVVWSGVQAKNQPYSYFKNNATIDLYKLSTGRYIRSYYIPDMFGSKIKSLEVTSKNIIALYDHHLVIFDR